MKRFSIIFLATSFILLSSFINPNKKVVLIDLGHGGSDYGSVFNGIKEKDILLGYIEELKLQASKKGIEIKFTRESDSELTLKERIELINNTTPDMMISLHINSSNDEAMNGEEIYFKKNNEASNKFAEKISHNGKIKEGEFSILRNSNVPSVLIEIGFLTNKKDFDNLSSKKFIKEFSQNLFRNL